MTSSIIDRLTAGGGDQTASPYALCPDGGDDLHRARDYCIAARQTMDTILMADRGHDKAKGRDRHWLSEHLAELQRGAKRLRALAIYRSTQDVLDIVQGRHAHAPVNWPIVDGRLVVLNKLIRQYTDGLNDIASERRDDAGPASNPEIEDLDIHGRGSERPHRDTPLVPRRYGKTPASVPTVPRACPTAIKYGADPDSASIVMPRSYENGDPAQTLRSLLPHASEAECEALQKLITISQPTQTKDKPDDFEPLHGADKPQDDGVGLADLMPDLVQTLLAEGREYGKTLSVSYALDTVRLPEPARQSLLQRLHQRLSDLIAGSMPLQGVGHLDLTADGNNLRIAGSGFDPFAIDILINSGSTTNNTPPKPRINENTEEDLRAQLAALMDGGLALSESAEPSPSDLRDTPTGQDGDQCDWKARDRG